MEPGNANEKESSSSSESELDFSSPKFNSLKALYSPKLQVDANAPVFDNVEQLVSRMTNPNRSSSQKKTQTKPTEAQRLERNFLPEQLATPKPRKELPNFVKYMDKQSRGPMSVLSRWVEEGVKVKVFTRGVDRVRGYSTGFLIAFDKYWNLAMVDVDETFTRKRHRKPVSLGERQACSSSYREFRRQQVGNSMVMIVKRRRKTELCQRHVPQIVLRGEHVVSVAAL